MQPMTFIVLRQAMSSRQRPVRRRDPYHLDVAFSTAPGARNGRIGMPASRGDKLGNAVPFRDSYEKESAPNGQDGKIL